ncbi:MAG: hypothetical protein P8078_11640, partial [bacterium]
SYSQDVDLVIKKSNLHYNQEYVIAYGPDAELSDSSRMAVLVYRDLLQPPQRIEMGKIENEWRAAYVLSDTSVKMILLAFQTLDDSGRPLPESIDNNGGEYWSIRVCDEYDVPVRGANMAVALSYTGWGDLRETDADSALDYLYEELTLYPNNYAALKMKYSLLLRQFEYSAEIRQEIDEEVMSYIYEEPENEERLNFALEAYRMIGNAEKAQEIEEKIIDLDPKGDQAAAQRLSAIMKIEEVAVRLDSLENFLQEFSGSRFTEYVLSGITTAAIELGDYERMKKVGDTLLKTANQPAGAASLAGIAGVFTEKGKNLKRAVLYAKKAVELAQSFDQKIAPPEISEEDWEEYNQRLEARYQDVLGWALYQYGEPREGITYLEQAAEIMPQSSTYFHYGKALLSKEGAGID